MAIVAVGYSIQVQFMSPPIIGIDRTEEVNVCDVVVVCEVVVECETLLAMGSKSCKKRMKERSG